MSDNVSIERDVLTLEKLLAKRATWPVKRVDVPALGESVYIRTITAGERDHLEALTKVADTRPQFIRGRFRAQFCAYFLSDKDGKRIVPDEEIDALDGLQHAVLDDILNLGLEFNNLASVGELEKN